MAFGIQTTVEVQNGVINNIGQFVSVDDVVNAVTVVGSLSGAVGREITLSVPSYDVNGYKFVKWIIETLPVTFVQVATSKPRNTIESMCMAPEEGGNNTDISEGYLTDGQFLYEDKDKKAPNGYYGIGSNSYYNHNTSTGLTGPFVCGQGDSVNQNKTGKEIESGTL